MSDPNSCCSPCATVETEEIPGIQGEPGADGTNGTDGVNAYTVLTSGFNTPAVGDPVNIVIADNSWMVVGQKIFIEDAGYYEVLSTTGTTGASVENLGYEDNVAPATPVASGGGVSPGGTQPSVAGLATSGANSNITSLSGLTTPLSVAQGGTGRAAAVAPLTVYATGTAYTLTAAFADLNFGTIDPTITFATTGKYAIRAAVMTAFVGATFVASRQLQFKLRANATTDLTSSLTVQETGDQTTSTVGRSIPLQEVIYDATAGDVVTIQGLVSVLPSAGTATVAMASIIAVPIPLY